VIVLTFFPFDKVLAEETWSCMKLLGVRRVADLGMHHVSQPRSRKFLKLTRILQVNARTVEQQIYNGNLI
jgi:hypothetical protein